MTLDFTSISSEFQTIFDTKLRSEFCDNFGAVGFLGEDKRYKVVSVGNAAMLVLIDTKTDAKLTFTNHKTEEIPYQFKVQCAEGDADAITNMLSQIQELSLSLQQVQPSLPPMPNHKLPHHGYIFP